MENLQQNHQSPTLTTFAMPQLIPISEVIKYTGLSRSTIYEMISEKSPRYDPTFPKKVQLSEVRVAWVCSEIAEWINAKISQRVA